MLDAVLGESGEIGAMLGKVLGGEIGVVIGAVLGGRLVRCLGEIGALMDWGGAWGESGAVLGAVLGGLFTYWFSVNGFAYPGMDEMAAKFNLPARFYPQVSTLSLLTGPLVVFVFTILAALYPALKLHKLHPVEAMRAV